MALIEHGRLLAVETPRTLSQLLAKYERIDFDWPNADLEPRVRDLPGVESVVRLPEGGYRVELSEESAVKPVLALLVHSGVTSIRTSRPSLEDVYVHIIGERRLTRR